MKYNYNDLNDINNKQAKNILLHLLVGTPVLLLISYFYLGNFFSLVFLIINYIVVNKFFINKLLVVEHYDMFNNFLLKKNNFYTFLILTLSLIFFNFLYIGYIILGFYLVFNIKKLLK